VNRLLREFLQDLTPLAAVGIVLLSMSLLPGTQRWACHVLEVPYGQTRLWYAAGSGNFAQLPQALREGADINAPNHLGNTVLMVAASSGDVRAVQELLRCGADPNRGNEKGINPLLCAIFSDQADTVEILLRHGAKAGGVPGGERPLHAAAQLHNHRIVQLLIAAGAQANTL
jgi:ankyrin repeat protein